MYCHNYINDFATPCVQEWFQFWLCKTTIEVLLHDLSTDNLKQKSGLSSVLRNWMQMLKVQVNRAITYFFENSPEKNPVSIKVSVP